ncbi:hypothetical protein [Mucilaginibacter terrae]|uniref:Uncharacterized protein n=1 Tax=Mucilaginibacter terrae TaxID=1955052 RepID=A0ABU3H3T5_9SPHI|nr:hypothetical protein [Mucilaginibacter terrae]MDT3405560.1 hypothetical protein [Mucilaginibacter terrae]
MKRNEKIVLAVIVAVFTLVYIVAECAFEMTDQRHEYQNGLPIFIICFLITAYYSFRYHGFKKWEAYTTLLFGSAFFWLGIVTTTDKLHYLYDAMVHKQDEAVVKVLSVKKHFVKSSFSYTNVVISYDNNEVEMQTSRINFFLLEHKKNIRIVIGKADGYGYYVTKLYDEPGERSAARYKYWKFWWSRNWFWPAALLAFILVVALMVKFGKPPKTYNYNEIRDKKPVSFWRMMAILMAVLLSLALLLYVGLIAYVYLVHGGCPHCNFWK